MTMFVYLLLLHKIFMLLHNQNYNNNLCISPLPLVPAKFFHSTENITIIVHFPNLGMHQPINMGLSKDQKSYISFNKKPVQLGCLNYCSSSNAPSSKLVDVSPSPQSVPSSSAKESTSSSASSSLDFCL